LGQADFSAGGVEEDPALRGGDDGPGAVHGAGVHRHRGDPQAHEVLGELGAVGGGLAAQRRGDAGLAGPGDDAGDGVEHGLVGLVEQVGAGLGVPVHAEHELGQVVGADGDPVDAHRRVLREPVDHGGDLGHDPPVQAPLAPEGAGVDRLQAGLQLPPRPHEGDHEVEVRRLLPHPGQQLELQGEQVGLADVAVAAPEADHRVVLDGLEGLAALEAPELVGPEVDGPVHDGSGGEGAGDAQQGRRHAVDELVGLAPRQQLPGPAQGVGQEELGPQQAHAVHGLGGDRLGVVGHGQVHVEAGGQGLRGRRGYGRRDRGDRGGGSGGGGRPRGDRAPGPVHGDHLTVPEGGGRRAGPDHAGHAELAGDDGGVAGHAPAVGDHGGGPPDGGHPVGVGHGGHQHLAGPELIALVRRAQDPDRAGGDAVGGREALEQHGPAGLDPTPGRGPLGTVEAGDGPGLEEVQGAVVEGPLGVLGLAPVVGLDRDAEAGHGEDLVVGQDPSASLLVGRLDPFVATTGHADVGVALVADPGADEARPVLVEHVGVGLDLAADHDLSQPEGALDDNPVPLAGRRVGGEEHPGPVGGDLRLDDDGDGRLVGQAPGGPVGDDPLTVEGPPAGDDLVDHVVVADDVGERLVHPGERGPGGVLRRGRGPHRDTGVGAETVIRLQHLGPQAVGHPRLGDPFLEVLRGCGQGGGVTGGGAGFGEAAAQVVADARLVHGGDVALGGHDEATGDGEPGSGQLTQVGPLAPDRRDVVAAEILEPGDVAAHRCCLFA